MLTSMENNMLSVIVPVFNGEKYIEETVDSILASSYSHMEVILLDDGSTDNSRQICEQFAGRDARVRYIYQKNQGIVAARNRGMELSSGEYICFCDQDDIVEPDMYSTLMQKITVNSAQIGMCSTGRLINGQKSLYEKLIDGVYDTEGIKNKLLYPLLFRGYDYSFVDNCNYFYGTLWKCIFDKHFIHKNNISFCRFINYEDDWIFVTQALSYASSVVTDDMVGYYWRVNSESESHKGKYIKNLPQKFEQFDKYTQGYLLQCIVDKDIYKEYIKVSFSEHFVDIYRNIANVTDHSVRKVAMAELKEYLKNSNYKNAVTCRKYLKKSAFRRVMVYTSLRYLGIQATVVVSKLADVLEKILVKSTLLVMLERNLKLLMHKGD